MLCLARGLPALAPQILKDLVWLLLQRTRLCYVLVEISDTPREVARRVAEFCNKAANEPYVVVGVGAERLNTLLRHIGDEAVLTREMAGHLERKKERVLAGLRSTERWKRGIDSLS